MIAYSIIKKSQLEGGLRLDAEYYQPEFFIDFSRGDWRPIGNFLRNCQYGLSQAMNDEKEGYPMFKMDDIKDAFLFNDGVRYANIPENIFNNFKLEKNDVLFNRVNAEEFVGRTGILKLDTISVFASYLIRLQTKSDSEILPDYLNIFLNSSLGIKQIRKFRRRAVNQANVNAEELKQIKIAVLPITLQKEIERLSNQSWRDFELSKSLYSQAENLLLEELGLKNFEIENDLSFIVKLSEVKSSHRADAEYFQPIYKKLLETVSDNFEIRDLKEIFNFRRGIFISTDYYTEEKTPFPYIRIKELAEKGGVDKSKIIFINEKYFGNDIDKLKENDLVIAIIGDTIGKTNKIDEDLVGGYCSNNTGRLRVKNEWLYKTIPECNEILFQSIFIQSQVEQKKAQTGQSKISDNEVKTIKFPVLPKPIQQKIADLVKKSHNARQKAKELLEQAKSKVENFIK